ncbi:penicillin-binding protein 2 [Paenibacillus sp. 7541]|uniref:peptidoglycan D,D-transpeptidase FtsI family protein n=1 Tax=Paenibacillus sp. 7541 TaxID=2026236 RepID=UPI000BA55797|nr:penicillin-binding transpeptidase domain-containing protein [Paenibacillus sp. 7541]PAK54499.1 cell division protein FtsI [Paenibacillus sp. 7541]
MKAFKPSIREQEQQDDRRFKTRVNLLFFTAFILFSAIIIRLAVLQFVHGPETAAQEGGGQVRTFPLQPMRGSIWDASGTPLAYSTSSSSLYMTLMKDYSNNTESGMENRPEILRIAGEMAEAFQQYGDPKAPVMTLDDVITALDLEYRKQLGYEPRLVKSNLSHEEIAFFLEHRGQFPGIQIVEESDRHYDPDTVAVQTIGYLKRFEGAKSLKEYEAQDAANKEESDPGLIYSEKEYVGYDGLERMFQKELRGKSGYISIPINPRNMIDGNPVMVPPQKGYDIHTTIHRDIQLAAEKAIKDRLDWLHTHPVSGKLHRDALNGYAVAMEVETGNVVAMASIQDYDPNVWVNGGPIPESAVNAMGNGTISPYNSGRSGSGFDSILLLGSTIKPLSVLIGLNEGFFGPNDAYLDQGGAYFGRVGSESYVSNSGGHRLGYIKPHEAIEKSSNAFMIDWVGKKLYAKYGGEKGVSVWDQYMKEFGLGVSTESGLPGEHHGVINYDKTAATGSNLSSLVYASFGQQGRYSTLQLAQYTVMLANEGKRIKPNLVSKITDQNGNVVQAFEREVLNEVEFSKEHWAVIKRGMNTQGLAGFEGFQYDFARKTGTSEQETSKGIIKDNGIFIAYAPRENPKLAVAVVIPEGGFGSQSAAPVARAIFDAYDEVYGLDGTPHPKTKTEEE